MKCQFLFILLLFCLPTVSLFSQSDTLNTPTTNLAKVIRLNSYNVAMEQINGKDHLVLSSPALNGTCDIQLKRKSTASKALHLFFKNGKAVLPYPINQEGQLILLTHRDTENKNQYKIVHLAKKQNGSYRVRSIPMCLSILPPLIAIILALIFKEVIISLFVGIWSGAFIAGGLRWESFYYFASSIFEVVQKYIIEALADKDHISILVFSMLIGGMVAIISKNGGMAGVVLSLSKYARSPRSTMFITWVLGIAIFFDDYANTLIVGNTMRSVTDRFKISREKLAYIVDSTAAPVTAIAFITTWIGAELSYISDATANLANFDTGLSPYVIFVSSLKYSYYPILTLIFVLFLIYTKRDYGSMLKAERRARTTGQVKDSNSDENNDTAEDLSPVKNAPLKWYNAVLPVLIVIFVTIFVLVDTGFAASYNQLVTAGIQAPSESWQVIWSQLHLLTATGDQSTMMKIGNLIGNANSYTALLWASFSGVLCAILLTISQKIMKLIDTMDHMVTGFKAMLPGIIILTLAWALAITTKELYTATFLTNLLQDSVSPYAMPTIIFILAAFIAFSTGSSWSTMAILYPIAIPTTWAICQTQGLDPAISLEILLNVISIVLAASVVGDHCSPISDTTILSSLASDCNHIDHVRTQMPYAITVGIVSLIAGTVVTLLGGGLGISLIILCLSLGILLGIIMIFGKRVD